MKPELQVYDLLRALSLRAPFDLAEPWDNVGLLIGNEADTVAGVVLSINLCEEALELAQAQSANVIICHHPPIFKPLKALTPRQAPLVLKAATLGFNVICLHTNYDLSCKKPHQDLAQALGFEWEGFVASRQERSIPVSQTLGKFITYVPLSHRETVLNALFDAGAGVLGNYTKCSFYWTGEGTFMGQLGKADPYIGKAGEFQRVEESRIEVIFPWLIRQQVIDAARQAHPYEEMAYDLIALDHPRNPYGYGFVAKTTQSGISFSQLVKNVKTTFKLHHVIAVSSQAADLNIRRIGFSSGSGSDFLEEASAKQCDLFITGEVSYHKMLWAKQNRLNLLILGHSYSEVFFLTTLEEWLREDLEKLTFSIHAIKEQVERII